MNSGERLLRRTEDAGLLLLEHAEEFGLERIIVYGSVARGTFDHLSDVDIMLVVSGDYRDAERVQDIILCDFCAEFEGKLPKVDVHTCSHASFYNEKVADSGTVFGGYLAAVKEEGITIWEK